MTRATLYVGLDLGQRSDYTALSVISASTVEVEVPESAQTLAAGYGLPTLPMLPGFATAQSAEEAKRRQFDYEYAKWVAQGRIEHGAPQMVRMRVPRYECNHLHRFALNTPYPAMVRHVCELLRAPQMRGQTAALVVDATGVGGAVLDLFREAPDLPTQVIAVSITSGSEPRVDETGANYWVPKRELVSVLQVLMPDPTDEHDASSVPPDAPRLQLAAALPLTPLFLAEAHNFKAKITAAGHDAYEAGPAGEWREGAHDDVVLSVALACWYAHRGHQVSASQSATVAAAPPLFLGAKQSRQQGSQSPRGSLHRQRTQRGR